MNHPNYRITDFETSKLAGDAVENEGTSKRHRETCLAAVRSNPGLTSDEYEKIAGVLAHKRLPELRREMKVFNLYDTDGKLVKRRSPYSGKLGVEWFPVQDVNLPLWRKQC